MKGNFPKITAKQWKHKLQFLLDGKDYNETLLWKSNEDIVVKPFYTEETDTKVPAFSYKKSQIIGFLYVTNVSKCLQEIEKWNDKNTQIFILKVPNTELCKSLLLDLPIDYKYILEIPNYNIFNTNIFSKIIESRSLKVNFHCDILGNFTRFGNWFHDKNQDLADISSFFNEKTSGIVIDSRIFQEAGASVIQQIAYSLSLFIEYYQHLKKKTLNEKTLYLYISAGENYFFEIAKLRAFRWIFESLKKTLDIPFHFEIIAQPSKRSLTLYNVERNQTKIELAMETGILGSADYLLPIQSEFYKKDTFNRVVPMLTKALKLIEKYDSNSIENNYYTDSLTQEITEKALKLSEEIQQSGGYLQVLKSHLLHKKIKEKANLQEKDFLNNDKKYISESDWEIFPFVKKKTRKTLIVPIFPYRISEKEEKLHYGK